VDRVRLDQLAGAVVDVGANSANVFEFAAQ
jgi:hypothetical protein